MTRGAFRPIDLPHDDLANYTGSLGDAVRVDLTRRVAEAHAQGRWRATEELLWNPRDPDFMAYWAQKCVDPITEPMRGAGLEAHFAPFRRTQFDLAPPGFAPRRVWRLSAVGDLMPTAHLDTSRDRLFRDIADLVFGADRAFANLEFAIADGPLRPDSDFGGGATPILDVTPDQFHTLTRHGDRRFDVAQLANNHALDCGEAGLLRAMALARGEGMTVVGAYETEAAAARPTISRIGDLRVGWIAHSFSLNGKPLPANKPWMVDVTPFQVVRDPDLTRITAQIRAARDAGCDLVLVCPHWGAEWEFFPWPAQIAWAHAFADAGADAVIGTHPHVIQPAEIYRPEGDGGRAVPILYSLGNLTTTMGAAYTTLSLVARLSVAHGRRDGAERAALTGLDLTPVALMRAGEDGETCAACVGLADLDAAALDDETRGYVDEMKRYADMILGERWRDARTRP